MKRAAHRQSDALRRLVGAAAIILAAILGCLAMEAALDLSRSASSTLELWEAGMGQGAFGDGQGASEGGQDSSGGEQGASEEVRNAPGDEQGVSSSGQGALQAQVPEGFEEETVGLAGKSQVRVAAGGSVIGFVEEGDADELFSSLSRELQDKGWREVDSGLGGCGSFVKGSGRFTWLFVSCVQSGDDVSAVIQCPPVAGDGR